MESTAASQGRKRLELQVCLLATERTPDEPAAAAVEVAAGVSDWMVIDPWFVVLME